MTNKEKYITDLSRRLLAMSPEEFNDFLVKTHLSDEVDKLVCTEWCWKKNGCHCPHPDDDSSTCPNEEWLNMEVEE